jgi:hypothetical protein
MIYQEQAICLVQASQDGINLLGDRDPIEAAKRLATRAVDICRVQNVRGYPSALNRAGRIFGIADFDKGLTYLAEGIEWAQRMSDGWFWFANLIEYVELSYHAAVATGDTRYIDQIREREPEILRVTEDYAFPDLAGRWRLLQGHLSVREWLETGDGVALNSALDHYQKGFPLLADRLVGSSGAAALPGHFEHFASQVHKLPQAIQAEWQEALRAAWSAADDGSILLLARLEELY